MFKKQSHVPVLDLFGNDDFLGKIGCYNFDINLALFLHHNGVDVKMETIKRGLKRSQEKVVITGSKNRERVLKFLGLNVEDFRFLV